jgi:hypothetical protein
LTAGGTDPTITQAAGTGGNSLTIDAGVTIALGGTSTTKLGAVVLKGSTDPGLLTLVAADNTSQITTGNAGPGTPCAAGVKQGTVVAVVATITDINVNLASGKIVSVTGAGSGNGTIAGNATSGDISIDSATATTDAST